MIEKMSGCGLTEEFLIVIIIGIFQFLLRILQFLLGFAIGLGERKKIEFLIGSLLLGFLLSLLGFSTELFLEKKIVILGHLPELLLGFLLSLLGFLLGFLLRRK